MSRAVALALMSSGLLVVGAAASSPPASRYAGTARSLVLSAAQAKYDQVTASATVTRPSSGKRAGFRSGWEASYRDTTPRSVNTGSTTIYVYDSASHARAAYRDACSTCPGHRIEHGIELKYVSRRFRSVPTVAEIAHCRNVYVAAITNSVGYGGSAGETPSDLAFDAGYLIGATYGKAIRHGMAACNEGAAARKPAVTLTGYAATRQSWLAHHVADPGPQLNRSCCFLPKQRNGQDRYYTVTYEDTAPHRVYYYEMEFDPPISAGTAKRLIREELPPDVRLLSDVRKGTCEQLEFRSALAKAALRDATVGVELSRSGLDVPYEGVVGNIIVASFVSSSLGC